MSHRSTTPSPVRTLVWTFCLLFPSVGSAASVDGSRSSTSPGNTRTLDEITIEGEIVMPQVLFVTVRDARRYPDAEFWRLLPSSTALALRTVLPRWLWVPEAVLRPEGMPLDPVPGATTSQGVATSAPKSEMKSQEINTETRVR